MTEPHDIQSTCVRLRPDVSVEPLAVDDTFWPRLTSGKLGDFHNEYLMCCFEFVDDWPTWEVHPNGDEIVMLLEGHVDMHLEQPGGIESLGVEEVKLTKPGSFVIVPKGTWHTAKVHAPSRMLFITAGEGTQNREG